MAKYIRIGPHAFTVPFDNENDPDCNFTAETVQEAIEELCAKDMVFHRRNSVGEFNLATSHCSGKMIDIGPLPVVDRCGVAVVAIRNRAQPYDICFPPKPKCRGETCKVGP